MTVTVLQRAHTYCAQFCKTVPAVLHPTHTGGWKKKKKIGGGGRGGGGGGGDDDVKTVAVVK